MVIKIANVGIERVDRLRNKRQNKQSTRQERANILKKYLQKRPVITGANYSPLTELPQKMIAIDDLNVFIKEAWLKKYGADRTVVYVRKITPQ